MDKEDAAIITEIVFLGRALRKQLQSKENIAIKIFLECDQIIAKSIDDLLSSLSEKDLSKTVLEGKKEVEKQIDLFNADFLKVANGERIQETLKKLQQSLDKLHHKVST